MWYVHREVYIVINWVQYFFAYSMCNCNFVFPRFFPGKTSHAQYNRVSWPAWLDTQIDKMRPVGIQLQDRVYRTRLEGLGQKQILNFTSFLHLISVECKVGYMAVRKMHTGNQLANIHFTEIHFTLPGLYVTTKGKRSMESWRLVCKASVRELLVARLNCESRKVLP